MMADNNRYFRLTRTVEDKGKLLKAEDLPNLVGCKVDHYTSTYYYNQEQYNQFKVTGSVKGIKDVKTKKLWFDFDCEDNPELAKNDAKTLIKRLKTLNIPENALQLYFSGQKGFNLVLDLKRELNPNQVKTIVTKLSKDLKTFDTTLYDAVQILRVPGTKHPKSGLYKIPLTLDEFNNLSIEEIKEKAKDIDNISNISWSVTNIPDDLLIEEKEHIKPIVNINELDLQNKPRQWKSSKWALMQGFFKAGERDTSMMVLAATCKAMGYDEKTSYYMCLSALEKSWERYAKGSFNEDDLEKKIEQVFSSTWNGGQYSEKSDVFLQKKAEELGIKELTTSDTVDIKGALKIYKDYAKNISKLTLKTGIEELDKKQRITVGMAFGIVASPGCGKSTLALKMLHSMSKNGELCIFFSYDMYAPLIVQKIIQKHWNEGNIEEVFNKYESNDEHYVKKVEELITTEYPNVEFCFETGQTIEDIYKTIKDTEQKHGKKCKFIVLDYNELVISDVSDPTQSSNKVAQSIRALAQKEQLCVLSLFQPSKVTGDPSQEIMSYRAAKGGSGIEQSLRLMLGVSRPGYDPNNPENDKFLNLKVLKNNMGQIFAVDLHWDGYRGEIRSLKPNEKSELVTLRQTKEDEKNKKQDDSWL